MKKRIWYNVATKSFYKGNVMRKIVVFLCYVVAALLAFSSFFVAGLYAGTQAENPMLGFVGVMGTFVVIFYSSMFLHEIGHVCMGMLTGYEFVLLGIGRRALVRKEERLQIEKTVMPPGAVAQYVGMKREERDKRFFGMLAGGLIAHLIIIFLCVVIGMAIKEWEILYPIIGLNGAFFLLNVAPIGVSDGAKIVELMQQPAHISLFFVALRHTVATYITPETSKLSDFTIQMNDVTGVIGQGMHLNAIEMNVISGHLDSARQQLEILLPKAETTFIRPFASITLLQVLLLQGDIEAAKKLVMEPSVQKSLNLKMTNVQVIRSLYELKVNKDEAAAKKYNQLAKKFLPISRMLTDEKQYYERLMQQIKEWTENPAK